ncbi:MAG: prohibitin family protein [Oscillospiraceae bacterium]|nr:prohibitin family protein [Oscillospiraceae bacterium]MDY6207455.1 prohibitin family protein [Oscillospiraceae bacterium]
MAETVVVNGRKTGKIIGGVIAAAAVLIVALNSFTSVQAGHSGVVLTFGKVSEAVLSEGLHVKIPFIQQIIQIDNRVLKAEVDCSSASKDLQTVSSTIALNYRVRNEASAKIYKEVGLSYENVIINPAIQECVKAVTAKYTAEQLITERQIISDQMKDLLNEKISSYGLELEIFNIISFEFTAEYNAAIEAKQTAQQNALKAEQDLQRIKVEAEQTVAQAQAEAEAYRLKSEQITPQMIAMEYIDKWDGKLPAVAGGDSSSMLIDISQIISEMETKSGTSKTQTPAPAVSVPVSGQDNTPEDEVSEE